MQEIKYAQERIYFFHLTYINISNIFSETSFSLKSRLPSEIGGLPFNRKAL